MKSILSALVVFSFTVSANPVYIHEWQAGGGVNFKTAIKLTNVCNEKSVNAKIKFWQHNGVLLSNKILDGVHTTDANGEINFSISPKVTYIVSPSFVF